MKISTEGIEGYAEMTAEQKLAAVLAMDVPDPVDMSQYIEKKAFDAKANEVAELSKKLKGKMTEDEVAAAERAAELNGLKEQMAALQADNQKLQRERTESMYKAQYLAMPGYDEKLAEETAKAMASGDMDKVFANQKKANEAHEKSVKAELMKQTHHPDGNGQGEGESDPMMEFAKKIGKEKAASLQGAAEGLKKFQI